MLPCTTIVGNAVTAVVGSYEGLLLTAVEFALCRIDGVGVGRGGASVGVFIKLFTSNIFPPKHYQGGRPPFLVFQVRYCLL